MSEITQLLQRVAAGEAEVRDPLYRLLYPELMRLARGHLQRTNTDSLDAPALLHEAWLRLGAALPDTSRNAFYAYASKVMHSVVVDYLRERGAQKRGGMQANLTLSTGLAESLFAEHSVGDVEEALRNLHAVDERAYRVVEMRYFGGLIEEDVAAVLGVSLPTVKRDWRRARAFLREQLC